MKASLFGLLLLTVGNIAVSAAQTTTTFNYTGAMQTFTVPACGTSLHIDMSGAQGGGNASGGGMGGYGGRVQADLPVTPGQTLNIFVGGTGDPTGTAGYNGGGSGFGGSVSTPGGGGGGGTDIRIGGTALTDRVMVAGGGGGGVDNGGTANGGAGGGLIGGGPSPAANPWGCTNFVEAGGGTQSAGGIGGSSTSCAWNGSDGAFGIGGNSYPNYRGAGGGGGWYGGGGAHNGGGGGGGSSYADASATNVIHTQGYQTGNGVVVIGLATPTITPSGPTTFCAGGSVTLTSSSASGNQWYLNGSPIGGETNQTYVATASGDYTVVVTDGNSCFSAASTATTVTVNPNPPTPTITPSGPTTFFSGGSVTLNSSSASGNQWYLNGSPIGGETNQTYVATASGDYTVVVTDGNSCFSAASTATTVTVNPYPTTTSVGSSQNPSVLGQNVIFTATVVPNPTPGPGTPTGSVSFFDGGSPIGGPLALNGSAQASMATTGLSGGTHNITASYSGDGTFDISTSTQFVQTVNVSTVGGSVNGLTSSGLVLRLTYGAANTTADLPLSSGATSFTFSSASVALGDAYSVSVLTQPTNPDEACTVSNASGTMPASDVTTVVVSCSAALYQVGVSISGLTGSGLALQLNGDSTLAAPSNATFYFTSKLASGSTYVVTIGTQPNGQLCSVTNPTGTVTTADVVVPVTCVAANSSLTLSIDDSQSYARYGQVLDYLVTLSNTGNAAATNVSVSSTASAGLDAANANWTCLGAGSGATCTASGSGAFADTATLPPNRSLTWLVSMPVFGNATDPDVTLSVSAPGAIGVADTDTLVIYHDGFNVPYGNGAEAVTPKPDIAGILGGTINQTFTLPPARGNGIEDVLSLRADNAQIRVQSVTLGKATLIRVLTERNGRESSSAWTHAHTGSTYVIGSVSDSNGQRVILLEGAENSLSAPLWMH